MCMDEWKPYANTNYAIYLYLFNYKICLAVHIKYIILVANKPGHKTNNTQLPKTKHS